MMECVDIISLDYVNKLKLGNNVILLLHLASIVYLKILNATISKMLSNAMFINIQIITFVPNFQTVYGIKLITNAQINISIKNYCKIYQICWDKCVKRFNNQ